MKSKLSVVLFIIAIVLIGHSVATDSARSREKRSPKPQFDGCSMPVLLPSPNGIAKTCDPLGLKTSILIDDAERGKSNPDDSDLERTRCEVTIKDLGDFQPVFIKHYELMIPLNGKLFWEHGETSKIACPYSAAGIRNFIRVRNYRSDVTVVETEITCEQESIFRVMGRLVDIRSVYCDRRVLANYNDNLWSPLPCMKSNKAIGFYVDNLFRPVFHICFDEPNAAVLYTWHKLYGREIKHQCIYISSRPGFTEEGFPDDIPVASTYNQVVQKARVVDLFSVVMGHQAFSEAEKIINSSYNLQRSHFTPDADGLFTTWRLSTYSYLNVAGMWNTINNGNWKALENEVRSFADKTGFLLDIFTGTYGTLAICTTTNYCPEFTLLADGRMPVPKWWWKIVTVPGWNVAIAFVVSNNPFREDTPICGLPEVDYGWRIGFDEIRRGKVSYCSVQALRDIVGYIPQQALATRVLPHYRSIPRLIIQPE